MSVPKIRIDTPSDLVQVVPYLLGFNPQDSLVLIVVDNSHLEVTARVDIANMRPAGNLEHLLNQLHTRYPDAHMLALAYTDNQELADRLLHRCIAHPATEVTTTLQVDHDTWRSDTEHGPVSRYGPIAAEATVHGLTSMASRDDLAAQYTSPEPTEVLTGRVATIRDQLERLTAQQQLLLTHQLISTGAAGSEDFDSAERIRLGLLVTHLGDARDLAALSITHETAPEHAQLWRDVAVTMPAEQAMQSMALAALASWAAGNGARACVAVDRALELADQRTAGAAPVLARVVSHLISNVVAPQEWTEIRQCLQQLASAPVQQRAPGNDREPAMWEYVEPIDRSTRPPEPPGLQPPAPGIGI